MDDLDLKLLAERARLCRFLTRVSTALQGLPVERLADVLPLVSAPIDAIARYTHTLGVPISEPHCDQDDGGRATEPIGLGLLLRHAVGNA